MGDEGKWNFEDDYERRAAIREEAEFAHQWVKHLAWATVIVLFFVTAAYIRTHGS